jgi:chromosome segregation ATPase
MTRSAILGAGAAGLLALCLASFWHIGTAWVALYLLLAAATGLAAAWLWRGLELRQEGIATSLLRQRLAEATQARNLAEAVVGTAREWQGEGGRLSLMEAQMDELTGQIHTLSEERVRLDRVRADLESRLAACQSDLSVVRARAQELAPLAEYLAQRDRMIRHLEQGMVARGVELDRARDTLSQRDVMCRGLEAEIARLERARDTTATAYREATTGLVERHQAATAALQAEAERLRVELASASAAVDALADRDAQLAEARERVVEEAGARGKLQARLAELEPMTSRLRDVEQRLAEREQGRAATLRDMETEIRRLRRHAAELEAAAQSPTAVVPGDPRLGEAAPEPPASALEPARVQPRRRARRGGA